VQWRHELVGATQHSGGVEARVQTPQVDEAIWAEWLIGCDGAHSVTRKIMDVQFEGRPFPETLILADVRLD